MLRPGYPSDRQVLPYGGTADKLRKAGIRAEILDLTSGGNSVTVEQWYYGLLISLAKHTGLLPECRAFWQANKEIGPLQRWVEALRSIVLPADEKPLVLFIDEIDSVLNLPFSTDEFFAGIREIYNRRAEDPSLNHLTFCLLGTTTPDNLVQNVRTTPFNIGKRIAPTDFTMEEAAPLAAGMSSADRDGSKLLQRVMYWTNGHPYLTQRVCASVAEDNLVRDARGVDRVVEQLFFVREANEGDHLKFVSKCLLESEVGKRDIAAVLDRFERVRSRKGRILHDPADPICASLLLSGAVRVVEGYLWIRNRVYFRAFDRDWILSNMPDAELERQKAAERRGRMQIAALAGTIVALMSGLAVFGFVQANRADKNAEKYRIASEAAKKMTKDVLAANQSLTDAQKAEKAANDAVKTAEQKAKTISAEAERKVGTAKAKVTLAEQKGKIAAANLKAAEANFAAVQKAKNATLVEKTQAVQEANRARHLADIADRDLYIAKMNLIQGEYENNNISRVLTILSETRISQYRGFEWGYWNRLCHRETRTLKYKTAPLSMVDGVFCVAFSPDGKRIAATLNDNITKVWNTETGREEITLGKNTGISVSIAPVAFSPDGNRIITSGPESTAVVWDSATGTAILTLKVPAPYISSVVFSPDGKRIAGAGNNNIARVWDAENAKEIVTFNAHQGQIFSVAFSPDGERLVTGSRDKTARIWDSHNGKEILVLRGHSADVNSVAFLPDGQHVVTSSDDKTAKIWDITTGKEIRTLAGHSSEVYLTQVATLSGDKQPSSV